MSDMYMRFIEKRLGSAEDIEYSTLFKDHYHFRMLYVKSICDGKKISQSIVEPFYNSSYDEFVTYIQSLPECREPTNEDEMVDGIIHGKVLLDLGNSYIVFEANHIRNNQVSEATMESAFQGPLLSFSEDIATNLNLIRHRYGSPNLTVEKTRVGTLSQTSVALVYDRSFVDKEVLGEIRKQLNEVQKDIIQAAGELHNIFSKPKRTLFPKLMMTERPDRIALNLSEGKVVLFLDGSPFALAAPAVFFDFFAAMSDLYQSYWISRFLVTLRYVGLLVSLVLPAFYVVGVSYNPEIFRSQLAVTIAGSRAVVPYPSFIEVLFMLLIMEMLTEASIRLPKTIGSTATTVGGLILGQASTQAGLVSNIMIIIVAAVAISNFVIPINEMSYSMRVARYVLLILASFTGLIGLVIGFIALIIYLADLRSYGRPYLKVFVGNNRKIKEIHQSAKKRSAS